MAETRDRSLRAFGGTATARHASLDDESLVAGITRHDPAAFAEAYARHGSRVHALARGLCGAARAQGLTEDIFLRLWSDPPGIDTERGSLQSYLLMQVHGRAVASLRREEARNGRASAEEQPADSEHGGSESIALSLLERADIDELVSALPVDERHAIALAYFGGESYRDVARRLGVPEGTVKERIRSGLRRMRDAGPASRSAERGEPWSPSGPVRAPLA